MAESKYPLGYTGAKTKELLKKIDELDTTDFASHSEVTAAKDDAVTAAVSAAASTSYTVTVPASAWTAGSLTHLGQTYAYKAAVTVAAAKGTGKGLIVEPAAGSAADLQAWGVLDVTEGAVTVWSKTALTGSIALQITEVR